MQVVSVNVGLPREVAWNGKTIQTGIFKDPRKVAGATGLEPAASCVTGRRSNQLNYAPA